MARRYEQEADVQDHSERLAKERQHYADLFRLAPDAYLVTDSFGNITEANVAAQKLLRLASLHLVGKPLQLFIADAHRSAFRTSLNELLCQSIASAKTWWGALRRGDGALPVEFTVGVLGDGVENIRLSWVVRPGTAAQS